MLVMMRWLNNNNILVSVSVAGVTGAARDDGTFCPGGGDGACGGGGGGDLNFTQAT